MESSRNLAGLIELQIQAEYYELMRALTQNQVDVIGFYYQTAAPAGENVFGSPGGARATSLILYDNYTGNNLGSYALTLDQISRDADVSQIVLYPLKGDIREFRLAIGRLLTSQLDLQGLDPGRAQLQLTGLIRFALGLEARPYYAGLAVVNRVLYALAGQDYSQHKAECGEHLFQESGWLGPPLMTVVPGGLPPGSDRPPGPHLAPDPGFRSYFRLLTSTLEHLYLERPDFRERVLERLGSLVGFSVTLADPGEPDPPSSLSLASSSLSEGPRPEGGSSSAVSLRGLRAQLAAAVAELRNQVPAVIQLGELAAGLNSLLEMQGLEPISLAGLDGGSYGCVLLLSPERDRTGPDQRVSVVLRAGETLILPIRGADLGSLDTDVLKDVLWYLDSLVEIHQEYLPLQMAVGRELALRQRR